MKNIFLSVLAILCLVLYGNAQNDSAKAVNGSENYLGDNHEGNLNVALFTPLYLDSAYDGQVNYRYGHQLPRFINPGLEFYEGVLYAVDSLERKGIRLNLHVFDTRSSAEGVQNVINRPDFDNMDIILGHVNANEARILANVAREKHIPFINVNFPNDAGVRDNPYYVILNATIKTQVTGLYRYLQKYHGLSEVIVIRKPGSQEDAIEKMLKEAAATTRSVPLKMKFLTVGEEATLTELSNEFAAEDSKVAVIGSLDVNFSKKAAASLALINQDHPVKVFGMPTFEVMDFSGPEYRNLEIYYGTPFPYTELNPNVKAYDDLYKKEYYSRTSDMVYRGIESFYYFANLLYDKKDNIATSLGEGNDFLFSEFDIQPVLNPQSMQIDYYENKRIYFIQKVDGKIVSWKY